MKLTLSPKPASRKIAACLLLLCCILNHTGCAPAKLPDTGASWPVMGTYVTVSVPELERDRLNTAVTISRTTLDSLESSLSRFRPDSAISRLNASAGGEPVTLPQEVMAVISLSLRYAEESGGAFDPTVGPLVNLWGFGKEVAPVRIPATDQISNTLSLTGFRLLQITNQTARLTRKGSHIDLGGIAKGYAVDRCYDALRAAGFTNVMINLGGNIRVAGSPAPGKRWRVAVRNPFDPAKPLGVLEMTNGMAVATSGNYERFVTIEGRIYCHIIDPRTGIPVENMAGVTVVSEHSAVETDALSTSLFVLGPEASRDLLALHPAARAVYVPLHQPIELLISSSFPPLFTPAPAFQSSIRR